MKTIARNKMRVIAIALVAMMCVCVLALAACSPAKGGGNSASGDKGTTDVAMYNADGTLSDEYCMSCHGESYEAVAELTADLGVWNPHNPIHGGYNSCGNCHAEDMSYESTNYCDNCHDYAPGTPTVADGLK